MSLQSKYKALTYRAKLQSITPDAYGNITYADSDTVISGYVEPLSGSERIANGKQGVLSTHRLFTNAGIDFSGQIIDGGIIYNIGFVANYGHHTEAELSLES